ncbi:MAG TPA: LLM class flavin-dependent oxidoreductase [Chloroflexota bacterium]
MSSTETGWGLWLHAVRPVADLASLAAKAEDLGASAILVADEGTDRDLFVVMAALAQRTRRALLVGAVTNPHSRHPVTTAAAFASLAELAPGRVVAGFGTGGSRVLGPLGLAPARPYTALVECIGVVQALWRGETVDHAGEFSVRGARLEWGPQRIPLAVAGRGPRAERLAAERADWVVLAGRAVDTVPELVARLRAMGRASIAWNPVAAWTEPLREELRMHLAYMAVDMPEHDRAALGLDAVATSALREIVTTRGPEAAAAAITDAVLERYAIVGGRSEVVARLSDLRARVRPELLVFDAHDYSSGYLEDVAAVAIDAGAVADHNAHERHGLDSHD